MKKPKKPIEPKEPKKPVLRNEKYPSKKIYIVTEKVTKLPWRFSIIDLGDAIEKAGGDDEDYMVNVYHKQIGVDVYLERITGFEKDNYERACKKWRRIRSE